jgi:asparagine synthase (glutamine-hydrolysing)
MGAQKMTKTGTAWADKTFQNHWLRPFPRVNKFEDALSNYLYEAFRFVALPGLLHYEDRNSMAFSLETRLPFLDFRLVEYLFSLPPSQKIGQGSNKVVLRNAMKGILPEAIRNRTDKMGFATPEDIWFRTVLRKPIHEMIHSKSFAERGYFNVDQVEKAFADHCQGKTNIHFTIWRWVNLEMWFRVFIDGGVWERS